MKFIIQAYVMLTIISSVRGFEPWLEPKVDIHVSVLDTHTLDMTCTTRTDIANVYILVRKTFDSDFMNVIIISNDGLMCNISYSNTGLQAKCLCNNGSHVICNIYDTEKEVYGDKWKCTVFGGHTSRVSDDVLITKSETADSLITFTTVPAVTENEESSYSTTSLNPKALFTTHVFMIIAATGGFVLLATVISVSVFVYRKHNSQLTGAVGAIITTTTTDNTLAAENASDVPVNVRETVHSYDIIPLTPLPQRASVLMTNSMTHDAESEPSSAESLASVHHYESIPTPPHMAKSDMLADELHIEISTSNLVEHMGGMGEVTPSRAFIFESLELDTLAEIAVVKDTIGATSGKRKRTSVDDRYESLSRTRDDKSQYNTLTCANIVN